MFARFLNSIAWGRLRMPRTQLGCLLKSHPAWLTSPDDCGVEVFKRLLSMSTVNWGWEMSMFSHPCLCTTHPSTVPEPAYSSQRCQIALFREKRVTYFNQWETVEIAGFYKLAPFSLTGHVLYSTDPINLIPFHNWVHLSHTWAHWILLQQHCVTFILLPRLTGPINMYLSYGQSELRK